MKQLAGVKATGDFENVVVCTPASNDSVIPLKLVAGPAADLESQSGQV